MLSRRERERWIQQARVAAARCTLRYPPTMLDTSCGGAAPGPGSGLEIHDFRPYQPGDDPRRIDWRAYARSDTLVVRRPRKEVAPRLQVALDLSASMGVWPEKALHALFLTTLLVEAGRRVDWRVEIVTGDAGIAGDELDEFLESARFIRPDTGLPLFGPWPAARALRVVVSDFLVPTDFLTYLLGVSRGAAQVAAIVVLSEHETNPSFSGAFRLVDPENSSRFRNLRVTGAVRTRYRARLLAHLESLQRAAAQVRAWYARVDVPRARRSLPEVASHCMSTLVRTGILEVR